MLTPPDEQLVRRDHAIPGLAMALDPAAFVESLRRYLPTVEGPARPIYLLYKPGASCLAAYRVRIDGREVDVHVRVYRLDAQPKLFSAKLWSLTAELLPRYVAGHHAILSMFPDDRRLRALSRLEDPRRCEELLRRVLPGRRELWNGRLERLRYKPERRYVARLWASGSPAALLKFHAPSAFPAAKAAAKRLRSCGTLKLPRRIGHSDRHRAVALEWLHGRLLCERISSEQVGSAELADDAARVGVALASLHGQSGKRLRRISRRDEAAVVLETVEGLGWLSPQIADQAAGLGRTIAARLLEAPPRSCAIHGDFYASQVLMQNAAVGLLDLDEAACGDPAADLGNFLAHLQGSVLDGSVPPSRAEAIQTALREGYRQSGGGDALDRVDLYTAAGLVRLAPHAFRSRHPEWPAKIADMLQRSEEILGTPARESAPPQCGSRLPHQGQSSHNAGRGLHGGQPWRGGPGMQEPRCSSRSPVEPVLVDDPFGLKDQPEMSFLTAALDPLEAAARLGPLVTRLAGTESPAGLQAIRVVRLKPQRRCLIEYDWSVGDEQAGGAFTTVAKVRMKGVDRSASRLLGALWEADFHTSSPDGVYVPAPVGVVPEWRMWLQSKAPGVSATELLRGAERIELARRIADAIHKLHRRGPPPGRRHTMADELRILRERLPLVIGSHPKFGGRLDRLLDACDCLAAETPALPPRPIHRDFYADHVLVDGARLCLLDLDLYCEGDPALDIGNFCGHLTEQSLRTWGRPDVLADCERALTDRYVELAGEQAHLVVQAYATLTLVRHIHISTLIPQRRPFTERLWELCERRLSRFRRTARVLSPRGGH